MGSRLKNNLQAGCVQECPGCDHRHLTLDQSLGQKKAWLDTTLSSWKNKIEPVLSVSREKQWSYRDRVCLKAQWSPDYGWHVGLQVRVYRNVKKTISIPNCPVHTSRVNQIIKWMIHHAPPYERFPLAYLAIVGGHLSFVLKTKQSVDLSWAKTLISDGKIASLWACYHPSAGNKVFSESGWQLIEGPRWLSESGLYYGPDSFQQPVQDLHALSLKMVSDFFSPDKNSAILDLYCGNGSSMALWSAAGADFLGVELSGNAVAAAQMSFNQSNCLRGTTDQRLPQMHEWIQKRAHKNIFVYANPPRTGIEPQTAVWISQKLKPSKIAYLSCSAGTLNRDLRLFEASGYETLKIQPFDFFPQTKHVETLALIAPKQI